LLALGLLLVTGAQGGVRPLSDAQVRQQIIKESIRSHGGACVCPYQLDRRRKRCGTHSFYSRPGGYPPQCYARDIDQEGVAAWRNEHGR
jgi:hypothetical protein